jgi:hypothetical protein
MADGLMLSTTANARRLSSTCGGQSNSSMHLVVISSVERHVHWECLLGHGNFKPDSRIDASRDAVAEAMGHTRRVRHELKRSPARYFRPVSTATVATR